VVAFVPVAFVKFKLRTERSPVHKFCTFNHANVPDAAVTDASDVVPETEREPVQLRLLLQS
jgi:hypothetical protein